MKGLLLIIVMCSVIVPKGFSGQLYRWVDDNGNVHVTSSPPEHVQRKNVQIQSYEVPKIEVESTSAREAEQSAAPREVVIYSTTWCPVCKRAKAYFRKARIPYKEYDVETNAKGKRDFERLGGEGVPIILVGNQRMVGFSEAYFERLYRR